LCSQSLILDAISRVEMSLLPLWSKQIKLHTRGLDPLGLSRVSEYIVDEMLPGITLLTNRGRNYIFYCWALDQISKYKINSYREFSKKIAKYESAYVLGSLLDAGINFPDGKGPIGRNRGLAALSEVKTSEKSVINVNFSVLDNQAGGYGQYFRPVLERLDLIIGDSFTRILTPSGKTLADIFTSSIKGTEYYNSYIENDQIPLDILRKYGALCSHLRLKEYSDEKKALSEVFFAQNQKNSYDSNSRKATLIVILKLVELLSKFEYNLTDEEYREFLFYGHVVKDNNKIIYHENNPVLSETLKEWRFFIFHEHFTFALEHILISFIESLKENPHGLSKSQFVETNKDSIKVIEDKLDFPIADKSINDVFNRILEIKNITKPLSRSSSELFDRLVGQEDPISEYHLRVEIIESMNNREFSKTIGLSLLLLLILCIRYEQYQNEELTSWIRSREYQHWSLFSFKNFLSQKIMTQTPNDFFSDIIQNIIEQHNKIAGTKIVTGNDTYRFLQTGDRFLFKMSYEWAYRTDRFDSIVSILEDIGLIEKRNEIFGCSPFGKEILERFAN